MSGLGDDMANIEVCPHNVRDYCPFIGLREQQYPLHNAFSFLIFLILIKFGPFAIGCHT